MIERSGPEGSKLVLKIFSKTASERYRARTDSPQIIADIFQNTVNLQKKYFSSKLHKFKIRNLNLSPGKSLSFEYNPLAYHPAGCSFDWQISRCKTRKIESFLNSKKSLSNIGKTGGIAISVSKNLETALGPLTIMM